MPVFLFVSGNIRVLCRVRPIIAQDVNTDGTKSPVVVSIDADDNTVVHLVRDGRTVAYNVDRAFSSESTQEEVSCAYFVLCFYPTS